MRKELIFNNRHNNYIIDKHYFQKDKKPINIDEVDTKKYCYLIRHHRVKKVQINTILDM